MPSLKVNQITNAAGTGAPDFEDGIRYAGSATSSLNTYQYTESASAPSSPNNGALWWDTTNAVVKIYANNAWRTVTLESFDVTLYKPFGDRGLTWGGRNAAGNVTYSSIEYIDITTAGNGQTFGNLTDTSGSGAAVSNAITGLYGGGSLVDSYSDVIEYVTISTTGNSQDFGDLHTGVTQTSAASNGTYGLWGGGSYAPGGTYTRLNNIQRVSISTPGNATDFGDLIQSELIAVAALADSSYCVWAGGSPGYDNTIQYVTVATPSNASDFGDLQMGGIKYAAGCADTTRGLINGGRNSSNNGVTFIDYITIANPSNSTDFGDLTIAKKEHGSTSNSTRGVFSSGSQADNVVINVIDYVTIQTIGNAIDFGDLGTGRKNTTMCSGNAA